MIQFFQQHFPVLPDELSKLFQQIWVFTVFLQDNGRNSRFLNTRNAILSTTSSVFISSAYIITIWYFHVHVLEHALIFLGLKRSIFSAELAMKIQCFRPEKISAKKR